MTDTTFHAFPDITVHETWNQLSDQDLNLAIRSINTNALNRLFLNNDNYVYTELLKRLDNESILHVLSDLPERSLKVVASKTPIKILRHFAHILDDNLLIKLLSIAPGRVKQAILTGMNDNRKQHIHSQLQNEQNWNKKIRQIVHSGSNKEDIDIQFERIKELKQTERELISSYKIKEDELKIRLTDLRSEIARQEEIQFSLSENSRKSLLRLNEEMQTLQDEIHKLREEKSALAQKRMEVKVPEYVHAASIELIDQREFYSNLAVKWSRNGNIAIGLAILFAIIAFAYGGTQFANTPKEQTNLLFLAYLLLKGLIIIALLGAWAKHAYQTANAYTHESLKRSERIHAINFGKLYFEIYGHNASQADMKSIFENWNISTDTAFSKMPAPEFDPKAIEYALKLVEMASGAAKSK